MNARVAEFDDHRGVRGYRLETDALRVTIIEHGGIVAAIEAPDRRGAFGNVLLGCPTIAGYLGRHPHFNCLVGRYSNRMSGAAFVLDGRRYRLDPNIPPHHLHGGRRGFGVRRWRGALDDGRVRLELTSDDGDGGYPGKLEVRAWYGLADGRLTLDFEAATDAPTAVSLTSHGYFNLGATPGATVLDHDIVVDASRYLPVSPELLQLGELRDVAGSPFDLRHGARLGDRLGVADPQLERAGGFDHTFVVDGSGLRRAARVHHAPSGRTLTVLTDQPGVQLYTGNTLDDFDHDDIPYTRHGALCLETQQFPDAPNHDTYLRHCPAAILRPGEVWRARTVFAFTAEG